MLDSGHRIIMIRKQIIVIDMASVPQTVMSRTLSFIVITK